MGGFLLDRKQFNFSERLAFSRGRRESNDLESIKSLISGCIDVRKTDVDKDRIGIDYIATLRGGAEILIDAKTRDAGCSKFWKNGPELAPEIWSVMPGGKYNIPKENAKTGWTLSESNIVDYIYCTFDPSDSDEIFILPFQLYRIAFRKNLKLWIQKYGLPRPQDSGRWESRCIFVPADIVLNAITLVMKTA
jgi:hypothetical protein